MTDKPIIVFDPGHGGRHTGASYHGTDEKDVTLEITRQLTLACMGLPATFDVTRNDDVTMSLGDRGRRAGDLEADFVLSIHNNASPAGSKAHGVECYYWPGNERALSVSKAIVDSCPLPMRSDRSHGGIIEAYDDPTTDRDDWIQNPRAVLGAYHCDTVLAECLYLTHEPDRLRLENELEREAIVCALRAGVVRAIQIINSRKEAA